MVFKNNNMSAMQGVDSMAYAKSKNKTYFIDSKDTVGSGVSLYLYSINDQGKITKENANTQIGAGNKPKNFVNFNDKLYYSYIGTSSNDSVLVSYSIENDKKKKEINLKTLNIFERGNPVKGLISTENNLYIIGTCGQVDSMDKNQKVTLLNNNENKNIKSKFVFFDNKIFLADSLSNKVEYFDTISNTYVQLDIPNNTAKIKDMIVNNNELYTLFDNGEISKLKISNSAVAKDTIISSNTNNFNKLISLNDQLLVSTLKGTSKLYKITSDKQTVSLSTVTFSSDINLMYVANNRLYVVNSTTKISYYEKAYTYVK